MPKGKQFFKQSKKKVKKIKPLGDKSVNIRELVVARSFWLWVSIGLSSILIIYFSLRLTDTLQRWESLQSNRGQLASKMRLWEGIITQYPSYRDAYFEDAILAYRLGNTQKVLDFLGKLSLLDQNFPYAKKLELLTRIQER